MGMLILSDLRASNDLCSPTFLGAAPLTAGQFLQQRLPLRNHGRRASAYTAAMSASLRATSAPLRATLPVVRGLQKTRVVVKRLRESVEICVTAGKKLIRAFQLTRLCIRVRQQVPAAR